MVGAAPGRGGRTPLPRRAGVVVVGGGVLGASVALHLTQAGVRDVLVVEAGEVCSGSSGKPIGGVRARSSPTLSTWRWPPAAWTSTSGCTPRPASGWTRWATCSCCARPGTSPASRPPPRCRPASAWSRGSSTSPPPAPCSPTWTRRRTWPPPGPRATGTPAPAWRSRPWWSGPSGPGPPWWTGARSPGSTCAATRSPACAPPRAPWPRPSWCARPGRGRGRSGRWSGWTWRWSRCDARSS